MDYNLSPSAHVQRNDNSAPGGDSALCGSGDVNAQTDPTSIDDPETFKCVLLDESESLVPKCNGDVPSLNFYKKQNGHLLQSIDEGSSEDENQENPSQIAEKNPIRPKSIVKTPSIHSISSAKRKILFGDTAPEERPVLRVQFKHGILDDSTSPQQIKSNSAYSLGEASSNSGSSSSSDDDSSLALSEARPPDGGWGWVVVFATFMVNLIADGVTFSFGVMYVNFLEYFGESKGKTAWIGSVFMAMPLLSGPVASFLTDRYGCRKMCIFGSILASLGFVASAFAPNMETLFFTFGIVAGFGLSLCYVAAVVIVAYYFEKKRSLATGLSVCGSGIGTFIFAPFTQWLLDNYGWRGATLILAGLFLNISVCGALMRDLAWISVMAKAKAQDRKRSREQKRLKKYSSSGDSFSDNKSNNTVGTGTQLLLNGDKNENESTKQFSSLVNLPTYVNNGERVPAEVLELLATHKNVYNVLMQNYPNMLMSRSFSDSGRLHEGARRGIASGEITSPAMIQSPTELARAARTPPRPPPTAYLKDLRIHRHSLTYRGAMLNIKRYRLRASSCPNIYRNSMTTIAKEKNQLYNGLWEFYDLIVDMLNFSHFKNLHFLLFAVSNFLLYMWYDVPYVYITDYAKEMGFSETDASYLISIIGIVNMVGEILLGWAGDWESVNAGLIYAISMIFCGGITALVPYFTSYYSLCALSGAFGFFIAANYSLTSIILVELISLENFTNAYGLLLLVQGMANLIGPPLAGWIYDELGSYDVSFYFAGFYIAISGMLLIILPITNKFKKYRKLHRKETASASTSSIEENSNTVISNGLGKKDKNDHIFV